jgi:hypothetical protein
LTILVRYMQCSGLGNPGEVMKTDIIIPLVG